MQLDATGTGGTRVAAQCAELFQIGADRGLADIDPQRHGRMAVVRLQDVFPLVGMVFAQTRDPPVGMVPARLRLLVRALHQFLALAQETAQTAIDEIDLGVHAAAALGRLGCLVYQRECVVGRVDVLPAQCQRDAEQRVHRRRRVARRQQAAQGFGARQVAPDLKHQGLYARAQFTRHGLHRCRP